MIGGFPHRQEDSFFHQAVEQLRQETPHNVISSLSTLGGFPISRVPKHINTKCLAAKPNIVVIQFATSDLVVPVRRRRGRNGRHSAASQRPAAGAPTMFSRLKWRLQGLIGDGLRLPPVTPPEIYLETMAAITRTFVEHQVIPVVLSPFVFGGQRSDRFARDCAGRLGNALAASPKAVYVDAYGALSQYPRRRMLLADGNHLSLEGHRVVAKSLLPCLRDLVGKWVG